MSFRNVGGISTQRQPIDGCLAPKGSRLEVSAHSIVEKVTPFVVWILTVSLGFEPTSFACERTSGSFLRFVQIPIS